MTSVIPPTSASRTPARSTSQSAGSPSVPTRRGSERGESEPEGSEGLEDTKGAAGPPRSSSARRQSKFPVPSDVVELLNSGASGDSGAGGVATASDGASSFCGAPAADVDTSVTGSSSMLAACSAGVCLACGESALAMRARAASSVGAC